MKIINESEYEKRLANCSKDASLFIANLYVDETLEELVGTDTEDYLVIVDDLANQIAYLVLGLLTTQEFKANIAELLYLEGAVEIQKAYDAINQFVLSKLNKPDQEEKRDIKDIKIKSPLDIQTGSPSSSPVTENSISHVDILSEIENPTPSLSTTSQFVKSTVSTSTASNVPSMAQKAASQVQTTPITAQTTQTTTPTNPLDLGGFGINPSNTQNPAQNIANKLGQNLSTPTTSIPKEVYVSKKIDPYKEPVI